MRKKIFLFILLIVSLGFSIVDFENSKTKVEVVANREQLTGAEDFPDANFYACIIKTLNLGDGVVPTDEQLVGITELKCTASGVSNVKGIEKLVNLKKLNLYNNQMTDIDLSNNPSLVDLNLSGNKLTNIDLGNNTSLVDLDLSDNKLTNIDLGNNTSLVDLDLCGNKLTNIDLTKNVFLKFLGLNGNQLTEINVSENVALEELHIYSNKLTNIDVSKNTVLKLLDLNDNQLTNIDVAKNEKLECLRLSGNKLTNIDVTKNEKLEELSVSDNYLTSIDVTKNVFLQFFDIYLNLLSSLDVSNNLELISLDVFGNKLYDLKIASNMAYLNLDYNVVKNIDFSKLTNLSDLGVYYYNSEAIYGNSFSITNVQNFLPSGVVSSNDLADVYVFNKNDITYHDFFETEVENQTLHGNDGDSYIVFFELDDVNSAINGYSGDVMYLGLKQVSFLTLSSDKYKIDETNNIIDVDIDDDNTIKKNLKTNLKNVTLQVQGTKLSVVYNDKVVKTFTLKRVTTNPGTGDIISMVFIFLISSIIGVVLLTNIKFSEN